MKNIKQFIAFALALVLLGSLAGCKQTPAESTPTTPETTEATTPADRVLTEEEKAILQERRDIAESYMRQSLSLLWKTDKNIIYSLDSSRDNGLKLYLIEGRIYQGVPYAYAVGTQDSFLEYATGEPDKNGVYTISGLEDTAVNYERYGARVGNDCSGVLTNAWSLIGTSFDASRSCEMTEAHGVIPVGTYNFNPIIDESTGNITFTGEATASNGPLTMYNAYAELEKADCLFRVARDGSNHSVMVVDVNVVYQGDMIDGKKSTVTVLEQTRKNQTQQKRYEHPELGEVFIIGGIDVTYTFADLFSSTYLPVTVKELIDPSPIEETWVDDTLEVDTIDNLFTGSVITNRYLDSVRITIYNEAGEIVQQSTGRRSRSEVKEYKMERFLTEKPGSMKGNLDLDALEAGNYRCTVTVKLTIDDDYVHTARDFTFSK